MLESNNVDMQSFCCWENTSSPEVVISLSVECKYPLFGFWGFFGFVLNRVVISSLLQSLSQNSMAWYTWWLQGSSGSWATSIPLALCPSPPLAPPVLFHISSLLQHFQTPTDFPGLQIALFFPLSNLSLNHLSQFLCPDIPHYIQTVMIFFQVHIWTLDKELCPVLAGTNKFCIHLCKAKQNLF